MINSYLDMKSTDIIKKNLGLGEKGSIQTYIDSTCIRLMSKYTPMNTGALADAANLSDIGSGLITQSAPQAQYLYYGMKMVDPITHAAGFLTKNGWRSRAGVQKVLTNDPLNYDTSVNALAGPKWFDRMKADHKEEILSGAQKIAGGGKR